jgi:hypothetical protein
VQGVLDRVSVVNAFAPPAVAVIVTGVVLEVAKVEARKVVELVPAGTVTGVGTLTNNGALSETATEKPLDSAFLLSWIVHVLGWPLDTVEGAQDSPVRVGGTGCTILTEAPVVVVEMEEPTTVAARPPLSWMIEDVFSVEADMVSVTVATTPFWIAVEFIPHATHVEAPLVELQEIDLPAAVAAPPAATLTEEKSEAE